MSSDVAAPEASAPILATLSPAPRRVSTLATGGLRAGWAELEKGALVFHRYAYIPGVTLSGTLKSEAADLIVGGSSAAHGVLRLGAHHALVGMLGE